MDVNDTRTDQPSAPLDAVSVDHEPAKKPAAWEEIEHGRFQPRRIRGSCLGRVLG